jgi:hypothetical protein
MYYIMHMSDKRMGKRFLPFYFSIAQSHLLKNMYVVLKLEL